MKSECYRVSRCEEAVGTLPHVPGRMKRQVRDSSTECRHDHEEERAPNSRRLSFLEQIHLPYCGDQVGDVLQDGYHRHLHVAEAEEGGDEHADKDEVDWGPHANQLPAQRLHLDKA